MCAARSDLADVSRRFLTELGDTPRRDDVALLLARTRAVPAADIGDWEFEADGFVSELVTNAVRHADGPVGLRLARGDVLVCEVTDPSNTQPRLRRAAWSDEGGRGLFRVAQLSTRRGSRYGRSGRTIWAEQPLVPREVDFAGLM